MQMMLPKRWETTDSLNILNKVPEILCNIVCLAKHFLLNRSREDSDHPINYTITNSAPLQPASGMFSCT